MSQLPGWWLVREAWRLGLLVAGAGLLVAAMQSAAGGTVTWWVFGIGAAAGAGIGGVALWRPMRSSRRGDLSHGRPRSLDANGVVPAVCALTVVAVLVGRYGAAFGMFLLVTGAYLVESFRRHWRQAREIETRRHRSRRRR